MMQYGFEYEWAPARPGFLAAGTPTVEVDRSIGEKWFGNVHARDYYMNEYKKNHPGAWVNPVERPFMDE